MKNIKFYDEKGILSLDAINMLEKASSVTSCECPRHLIELLKTAKEFTKYQDDCLIEKPHDQHTHEWLKATSINLEHFISSAIVNLARMEGIIDENNQIQLDESS
ncbi:hypothetical protein HBN50_12950 [Halobacteriovorax sp. GB3]|uniref:hypothetical protein n=1 Tax=Halobacteriovorax sp. GB3 TaxID=2719615 RepID=UPI00235FBFBA|nr:hypothetical protein [Halobacteriovorax sp. GB3]MDD0854013.1 hypothetical protein [Halobacteriovorax sp. GB3]